MNKHKNNLNKIKLCFLINCFTMGGAQAFLYNLVKNLDNDIFDIYIIGIKNIGPFKEKFKNLSVNTYTLNVTNIYDLHSFLRLFRLLKIINPDILHTNLFYSHIMGRLVSIFFDFKVIGTIHNTLHYNLFMKLLLKITDFLNDYNIAICKKVKEVLLEKKISKPNKIKVIYNSVVYDRYQNELDLTEIDKYKNDLALKNNDKVLISIGRLEKPKGYLNLIKSIKILDNKYDNYKLLIIGKGNLYQAIKKEISKNNLEQKIKLLSEREDIEKLLKISDIYIMSSLWEGLPISLLEAMASGLPVITTDVGGINEVIDNNRNGLLVEPGNIEKLAYEIENILQSDNEKLTKMGLNAKNTIKKYFSLKDQIKKYETLYMSFSR